MADNSYYFSHDYNARTDPKIKKLLARHGIAGYGIYWAIIEDLYNNANALPTQYDVIAFDLRCDEDVIRSVINDFDLFQVDEEYFGSPSVAKRLLKREEKSLKARRSAAYRWNSAQKEDANAMRTHTDSNAIKGKDNKKKDNKDVINKGVQGEKNQKPEERKIDPDEQLMSKIQFSADFEAIFLKWLRYKRKRKQSYIDEGSAQIAYNQLVKHADHDPAKALEIVEQSMGNNWSGLYELKTNQTAKQNGNRHREVTCQPGDNRGSSTL